MPIEYRATEMSDIAAASAGTAREARHLVTGRRRVSYSCNLHRNAPNIGHCEHPNVVPMRAWHRGNRPFVQLNVRLGSTSPSNDRCQRHCGTTAVGPISDRRTRWRSLTSLANLHLGLLGDLQRIVDLDTEIPHGAFEFRMPEQKLNGSQISGSPLRFLLHDDRAGSDVTALYDVVD